MRPATTARPEAMPRPMQEPISGDPSTSSPVGLFVAGAGFAVQGGRSAEIRAFFVWAIGGMTSGPLAAAHRRPNAHMKNDEILSHISQFCRHSDMAESTFGRRAVNDGKLVHRLREGKRITIDTLDR